MQRNKVTISNLWKRNSVKVVNNRILFIEKIQEANLDNENPFVCKI